MGQSKEVEVQQHRGVVKEADNDYYVFDSLNHCLGEEVDLNKITNQEDLRLYLTVARLISWDIPSALLCDHLIDKELPMHRPAFDYPASDIVYNWDEVDDHFLTVHHLDLKDPDINWSFDT